LNAIGSTSWAIVMVASGRSSFARLAQEAGGTDWADALVPATAKNTTAAAIHWTAINVLVHALVVG
jgi:hypothetical protein